MPILASILTDAAQEIGATVFLEPEWKYAGRIMFASGKCAYFRGSSIDINPHGSSEIAKDKDYAAFFMKEMGFPVVSGTAFFSDEWCIAIGSDRDARAAETAARTMGYPLIVKPNSASQGRGVYTVENVVELRAALHECFVIDRVAILQPFLRGRDYRIVVLGNEVLSAYERTPLVVRGDGLHTIDDLLYEKADIMRRIKGRAVKVPVDDLRINSRLRREGLQRSSIPELGRHVFLLDNANLSSGGDAVDVTGLLASDIVALCIALTSAMGLKLCGVDLIVNGDITKPGSSVHILEVNSSPGLDNYAAIGQNQKEIVHNLYKKVLIYLEKI